MPHTATSGVKDYYTQICHFTQPEQMFGDLGAPGTRDQQLKFLNQTFKYLVKLYHPDIYTDCTAKRYATEVCSIMCALRDVARQKIANGTYGMVQNTTGTPAECVITTATRQYQVVEHLVEGEFADIFLGIYADPDDPDAPVKKAALKIIAEPKNNNRLQHEIRFYRTLEHQALPQYLDSVVVPDDRRQGIILSYLDGCDLTMLRERYPQGLPDRHVCWILDRLLSVIGLLHAQQILHGSIAPEHILVQAHPNPHHAFLVDFLHCLIEPDNTSKMTVVKRAYTAPEVLRGAQPHPVSELYALGKAMVYLLGGDVSADDLPDSVHPQLAAFLKRFLTKDPLKRVNDAWRMHVELQGLRQRLFGAKHEGLPLYV